MVHGVSRLEVLSADRRFCPRADRRMELGLFDAGWISQNGRGRTFPYRAGTCSRHQCEPGGVSVSWPAFESGPGTAGPGSILIEDAGSLLRGLSGGEPSPCFGTHSLFPRR